MRLPFRQVLKRSDFDGEDGDARSLCCVLMRSLLLLACVACASAFLPAAAPLCSRSTLASPPSAQMSRVCDISGKRANNANRVTFSNKHNAYLQFPNLQTKKFYSAELDRTVKLKVATSTMRTIRKLGLDETAKKYNVDLSKF
ncbi:hypothetical protein AB1Y20_014095 [Prymnesium parvum]|uniref:Large ribosomal subunit protein bL28c n=1 Tax=Prymnesium parvum TaxID=97485 RepID=A0AB34IGC7_PRYPA